MPPQISHCFSCACHGFQTHLQNIWAAVTHPHSAIPESQRFGLEIKAVGATACAILILAETTPVMAAVATLAALDPIYEAIHRLDETGSIWRAIHENQYSLPFMPG